MRAECFMLLIFVVEFQKKMAKVRFDIFGIIQCSIEETGLVQSSAFLASGPITPLMKVDFPTHIYHSIHS
jgi:hypothetical protein